jgi:hypothetical protein
VTTSRALVDEAAKLFDADMTRQPYESSSTEPVISPANARARLAVLIASALRQLLIYDPRVSDAPMLRLCQERAKAGVDVWILGAVSGRGAGLRVERLQDLRLHVRAIVRDGIETFIGSQSLRGYRDRRREVGIVVGNRRIARQVPLAREYRVLSRYEDIPPIVRHAILAAEDKRFFSHNGVDYGSVPRVLARIRVGTLARLVRTPVDEAHSPAIIPQGGARHEG